MICAFHGCIKSQWIFCKSVNTSFTLQKRLLLLCLYRCHGNIAYAGTEGYECTHYSIFNNLPVSPFVYKTKYGNLFADWSQTNFVYYFTSILRPQKPNISKNKQIHELLS